MTRRGGFTLIELAIVLVVIGLVAGGVLVGTDLIRQAELRRLVTDVERYQTAVLVFVGKYDCLPGDCPSATAYFGGTADGDGNGQVGGAPTPAAWTATGQYEPTRFWQHLSLAGLTPGTYSGVTGSTPQPGAECPVSLSGTCPLPLHTATVTMHLASGGWQWPQAVGAAPLPDGHVFQFGHTLASHSMMFPRGGLSGGDLLAVDLKADDGRPFAGRVQTLRAYDVQTPTFRTLNPCPCLTDTSANPDYQTGYTTPDCPAILVTGF